MREKVIRFINYIATSLAASVVDLALFYVFLDIFEKIHFYPDVFYATICARVLSSVVAYILNRKVVFKSNGSKRVQFNKHAVVEAVQMMMSASLVTVVDSFFHGQEIIEKCAVDLVLFFVFYFVQKYWVYKEDVK